MLTKRSSIARNALAIRQCAARASTLITHKHSPKENHDNALTTWFSRTWYWYPLLIAYNMCWF